MATVVRVNVAAERVLGLRRAAALARSAAGRRRRSISSCECCLRSRSCWRICGAHAERDAAHRLPTAVGRVARGGGDALLGRGPSGCGKSSLLAAAAAGLGAARAERRIERPPDSRCCLRASVPAADGSFREQLLYPDIEPCDDARLLEVLEEVGLGSFATSLAGGGASSAWADRWASSNASRSPVSCSVDRTSSFWTRRVRRWTRPQKRAATARSLRPCRWSSASDTGHRSATFVVGRMRTGASLSPSRLTAAMEAMAATDICCAPAAGTSGRSSCKLAGRAVRSLARPLRRPRNKTASGAAPGVAAFGRPGLARGRKRSAPTTRHWSWISAGRFRGADTLRWIEAIAGVAARRAAGGDAFCASAR